MFCMCTIIAKNYISLARTLVDSFLQHHPSGSAYVLLVDESEGLIDRLADNFEWVSLRDIGLPNQDAMQFKYNLTEFSTAVKPFFLEYLLRNFTDNIIYFDPDILITHRLDELYRRLQQSSIILTPHILSPLPDDHLQPEEVYILQAGVYNLGFLALARTSETYRMLNWWKERLLHYCLMDPTKGYHVDQRWMDLVPALFTGVHIAKEPQYNAAYWNLHERHIVYQDGMFLIAGKPLGFYHFSGFLLDLSRISKHQTRHQWGNQPDLRLLFGQYVERILAHGYATTAQWRYTYNHFDNNVTIPSFTRTVYRKLGTSAQAFGNPFLTLIPNNFYQWIFIPHVFNGSLPQLLLEIYNARIDLQRMFPDPLGANKNSLINWARVYVPLEYGVEHLVWGPVMDAVASPHQNR